MKEIRVLLVDDHPVVRDGLRALLEATQEIKVVGLAHNGHEAVKLAAQLAPQVVLMDVAMPQLNGVEATRQILRRQPDTKVIVLSAYNEDARVAQILEHGASGYLVKQDPASDVAMAIREVAAGNAYFSPCISQHFRAQCRQAIRGSEQPEGKSTYLTSREAEVLQLVAEGYANKQVADVLGIGFKTVQKHRQSLMDKLRIHETAGLTRYAVAQKVIEVPGRVPRWSERGYASNPAPASERALSASSANFGSPVGSVS